MHLTNTVLRQHGLTWTGFVVLWVVWIWDGMETRRAAESAAISKATLTGVVKTLEARGLLTRRVSGTDRRLVILELSRQPTDDHAVSGLQRRRGRGRAGLSEEPDPLTDSLRSIVTDLETKPAAAATDGDSDLSELQPDLMR